MANEPKKSSKSLIVVCVALLAAVVLAVVGFAGKTDLSKKISSMFTAEQVQTKVDEAVAAATNGLLTADEAKAQAEEAVATATAGLLTADQAKAQADEAVAAATSELLTADQVTAQVEEAVAAATSGLFTDTDVQTKVGEAVAAATAGLFTDADVQAKVEEAVTTAVTNATAGLFTEEQVQAKVEEAVAAAAATAETAVAAVAETAAPVAEEPVNTAYTGSVVVLHTNDIHGHAQSTDSQLGYARIASIKKNLEAMGATVLMFDAGDATQGAPIVNLSQGATAISFMNAAGYNASAIGNHEFDWGLDNFLLISAAANYPYLNANILYKDGGNTVFTPNTTFEVEGFGKIGVFGLDTPEVLTKTHPDKVKGITILQGEELYACAQAQVDELKAAGCNYIICLGHLGDDPSSEPNRSVDVLAKVTGIDLFIDGHSHTTLPDGEKDGDTLRVSTGEYSEAIGFVVISVNDKGEYSTEAGLYTIEDLKKAEIATGEPLLPDEEVNAVVEAANEATEKALNVTFAKTEVLLNGERDPGVRTQETNLGDFAADAILWAAKEHYGDKVDAALTNGGGIRASIQIGDVTMKDMKTVFPFGNEVAILTVKGSELLEALEAATWSTPVSLGAFPQVAGIEFTIDTSVEYVNGEQYPDSTYFKPANPGSRVTITTVGGEPFDPEKEYIIATNDFTAAGGDTYYAFRYAYQQTGDKSGVSLEDALVNYTLNVLGGTIGQQYAEPQGRITIK